MSGIYQILNTITLDRYIGSSSNLKQREVSHWSLLRNNKHYNNHLQSAVNKYGIANFKFIVLGIVSEKDLIEVEQLCVDEGKPKYNKRTVVVESNRGYKFGPSKRRGVKTGKPAWNKGMIGLISKEHKKKMVDALRAKGAWNKGVPATESAKEHLRKLDLGNKKVISFDWLGYPVGTYSSINQAAEENNTYRPSVSRSLNNGNSHRGLYFKYLQ